MTTNYYATYAIRYYEADQQTRNDAKRHWQECHADNLRSGREDLIIFSAKMLGSIEMAEMALNGDASGLRQLFECQTETIL